MLRDFSFLQISENTRVPVTLKRGRMSHKSPGQPKQRLFAQPAEFVKISERYFAR